jgi:hypothetical protein
MLTFGRQVVNRKSGAVLGVVERYPEWRCHVFAPRDGTVFSPDCLRALARYLDDLQNAGPAAGAPTGPERSTPSRDPGAGTCSPPRPAPATEKGGGE